VPLYLRGRVSPLELLIEVGAEKLRVKENARLSHVRLFRIEVRGSANAASRKNASKKSKREKQKT
jgi:hypothetical protein